MVYETNPSSQENLPLLFVAHSLGGIIVEAVSSQTMNLILLFLVTLITP
jgi:predicted alpha/beta hydrolase family esterase